MANRWFNQFEGMLEKGVVNLFMEVAIGATGAPTLTRGKGISSIVRNSAGDYTVTLQDKYLRLLDGSFQFKSSSGIPAASSVGFRNTTDPSAATPIIRFVCSTAGGGSATDPGSGEVMYADFLFSNSSAL